MTAATFILEASRDARYALRRLMRRPVYALALVLTMGLSIGVSSSVFSLVDTLLVKGLPYSNGGLLITFPRLSVSPKPGSSVPSIGFQDSPPRFEEWKSASRLLHDASLYVVGGASISGALDPQRVRLAAVTSNLFEVLGVPVEAGRTFSPDEERPGQNHVVIISDRLWRGQFGGNTSILGKTISLNGESYTVVGVAPAGEAFPPETDLWTPTIHDRDGRQRADARLAPTVIGLMNTGATISKVEAEQRAWLRGQNLDNDLGVDVINGAKWNLPPITVSLKEKLLGSWKRQVLVLFGAVALILLIGCANVANLVMADTVTRDHEFAVRTAIGMSTLHLLRQLIIENVLVALMGGFAGLAIALGIIPYLRSYLPDDWPKFAAQPAVDARVWGFAIAVSIVLGAVVGLAACRPFGSWGVASGAPGSGERMTESSARKRFREIAVCTETGLVMVLLVGAGLLVQTLRNLIKADLGFQPANVITINASRQIKSPQEQVATQAFYTRTIDGLHSLPGVQAVGGIDLLPSRLDWVPVQKVAKFGAATVENFERAAPSVVSPGYFQAMGISLLAGRDFNELDDSAHEPAVILDQMLARKLWPTTDPIGQQILVDGASPAKVIGVVGAVHLFGPRGDPFLVLYRPISQSSPPATFNLVIRADPDRADVPSAARAVIREGDPEQAVEIQTMDTYVARKLQWNRGLAGVVSILSVLGLSLAIIGVYGLVSYSVASRTRELGIRMALGEGLVSIVVRSLSAGMRAVFGGIALGLLLSLASSKLLESEVAGLNALDAKTLTGVAGSLIVTATFAGSLALRRISFGRAVASLRQE